MLFGPAGAMASESGENATVVMVIQGRARVSAKSATTGFLLKKGDRVTKARK